MPGNEIEHYVPPHKRGSANKKISSTTAQPLLRNAHRQKGHANAPVRFKSSPQNGNLEPTIEALQPNDTQPPTSKKPTESPVVTDHKPPIPDSQQPTPKNPGFTHKNPLETKMETNGKPAKRIGDLGETTNEVVGVKPPEFTIIKPKFEIPPLSHTHNKKPFKRKSLWDTKEERLQMRKEKEKHMKKHNTTMEETINNRVAEANALFMAQGVINIYDIADDKLRWRPAPIESSWFQPEEFRLYIEKWMIDVDSHGKCDPVDMRDKLFLSRNNTETASRLWIPDQIDNCSPDEFWANYIRSEYNAEDGTQQTSENLKPWWLRFSSPTSNILLPIEPTKHSVPGLPYHIKVGNSPLLLRPFEPKDVRLVTKIYNTYMSKTVSVPETTEVTSKDLELRINKAVERGFPVIVAVSSHGPIYEKDRSPMKQQEVVVGFAIADDYDNQHSLYKHSADLKIFVHTRFYQLGVGRSLMNKMMAMLDTSVTRAQQYMWKDRYGRMNSCGRDIKVVIVQLLYDEGDNERFKWMSEFITGYGFKHTGNIPNLGEKLGKSVSLGLFVYNCNNRLGGIYK